MTNSAIIQDILNSIQTGFRTIGIEHLFIAVGTLGLLNALFPGMFWFLKEGWKIKGTSEPSGLWLFNARLGGLFLALVCFWWAYKMHSPEKALELEHKAMKYGYELQTNLADRLQRDH